jgi:hypothetical protein
MTYVAYVALLVSYRMRWLQSIWQALVNTIDVYEQTVVATTMGETYDMEAAEDMDGDRISMESLAFELIECVREVRTDAAIKGT